MAFNAPHDPFHEPPSGLAPPGGYTAGTGDRGMYIRMLEALDTEIGRLLGSFGSGVLAKTNIIVIGDNGTPNTVVQAPFGNGHSKGDLYQGGVRVPLFAKGPDISAPAGSTSDKLVTAVDLFSTILELGGINSAAATASVSAIDSKSLLPLLRGNADVADRTAVVEKFGLDATDGRALVSDDYPDYKLVIFGDRLSTTDTPTFEFYNITADPNEQSPLTIGSLTGTPLAAYNHLIAKDAALGGGYSDLPTVASTTLYIELPATGVNPPVPALTNANGAINVTSVTVNGQAATYVSRVNSGTVLADESDDAANQHWVKVTTTLSGPYTTANVVFPNTPGGAARAYNSINTILVKP
jgi:hypothetical protein